MLCNHLCTEHKVQAMNSAVFRFSSESRNRKPNQSARSKGIHDVDRRSLTSFRGCTMTFVGISRPADEQRAPPQLVVETLVGA